MWVRRIKAYIFSPDTKTSTILEFFDEVFYLARTYPKSSVLKFALSYILNANDGKGFDNVSSNTLVQFSLQCALYEAGCLEHCFKIVKRCEQRDFINYGMILSTLERIIQKHAPLNHSSEVCWSLWAINELSLIGMYTQSGGLKLANQTVDSLLLADDCCILTLGMYLHQKLNIFGSKITNTHKWYEILHDPEGYDDYWMYWYEGITRGWVKQVTTIPAKYAVLIKASQANISFLK